MENGISLIITVLAFLMILTVYGRFFRLYLYAALSPVALASFAGEGTSQMGRAFLKSYMGVCLQGAVIVLASVAAISLEGHWRPKVPAKRPQVPSGRPIEQASSD